MKSAPRHGLKALFGILLLQLSTSALAFTLIELPGEDLAPSSSITDSMTLNTSIQPVIGTIREHLNDTRRKRKDRSTAQHSNVLAANSYVNSVSDLDYMAVAYLDQDDGNSDEQSLWINSTFASVQNDFSRTSFNGGIHMLMVGFDYSLSEKHIFGIAFSYENSDINTRFNSGNEQTDGFGINPYFAFLLSDNWSFDLNIGYGEFDTEQYRTTAVILPGPTVGNLIVDSNFSSTREFISINLTGVSNSGSWYWTGSLGLFAADNEADGYVESSSDVVAAVDLKVKQWNLAGEAAYTHGDSESYLGLIYEKNTDFDEVRFLTGAQPANDDDSFLISAGWRYYGKTITASFELSSRVGLDEFSDNAISTTLRINL